MSYRMLASQAHHCFGRAYQAPEQGNKHCCRETCGVLKLYVTVAYPNLTEITFSAHSGVSLLHGQHECKTGTAVLFKVTQDMD